MQSSTETPLSYEPVAPSRFSGTADRLSASLERVMAKYSYLVIAAWSILYFAATCYRASRKLFWFDELYTFFISGVPHFSQVWSIEMKGVDFNPPLFYLLTRFSQSVFGHNELGTRMPEIIGFWVFCLCLYRFVSRRTTALTGFVSMSLPVVTLAYFYAYEARPHALVLGFAGLAFVSWQSAAERTSRRTLALLLLGVSLASALLTHSYAFVLYLPIALGELARLLKSKRIDLAMWVTLALSGSAILVSIPLLRAARSDLPSNFFHPKLSLLTQTYQTLLGPASAIFCVAVALLAFSYFYFGNPLPYRDERKPRFWELAAVAGTFFVPFLVFAAAYLSKAPFFQRYSLSCVVGLSCFTALALAKRPIAAFVCCLAILALSAEDLREFRTDSFISEPSAGAMLFTKSDDLQDVYKWMESDPHRELPIVILDNLTFATVLYYAPPSLRSRLMYDSLMPVNGGGYYALQQCCGAPGLVFPDRDSAAPPKTFLAYGTPRSRQSVAEIRQLGGNMSVDKVSEYDYLFLVQSDSPLKRLFPTTLK